MDNADSSGEEDGGNKITTETEVDGVEMETDADDPDVTVLFQEIRREAQEQLDEIGDDEPDSKATDIILDAAEKMGRAQAKHGDAITKPRVPGKLTDLCKGWPPSRHQAHDTYEQVINAYEDDDGGSGDDDDLIKCSRLQAILQESLTYVKKTRTTDLDTVDVSAKFRFDIDPSDFEDYEFTTESEVGEDGDEEPLKTEIVTFSMPWKQATQGKSLWQAFTAATSRNHVGEYSGRNEDVGNWLMEAVDDLDDDDIHEVTEGGAATAAIRALAGEVNQSKGYGNHSDALEEDAVYLDDAPPDHSEIWIPQQIVASVRSQHEVTSRKMQEEISHRELNSMDGGKVSDTKYVNGKRPTWWRVKSEFVEVLIDPPEDDFRAFSGEEYADEAETSRDRAGNDVPDPGIVTGGDERDEDDGEGEDVGESDEGGDEDERDEGGENA